MDILIVTVDHPDLKVLDEEEVNALKKEIQLTGLLHPITVTQSGSKYKLVTGRKRLRACMELNWLEIQAKVLEPMTDARAREIHLNENLRRHNLPWYEQVELEKELHEMRVNEHGVKTGGRPKLSGGEGWSQADTARELGLAMGTVSQDIALANAIKRNPHLKKVKDKVTALKLIRQTTKREISENESLIPSSFEMDQVFLGDSLDILSHLPPNTFDACITDPPWSEYKDDKLRSDESTIQVFKEVYRVLKGDSFLYCIISTTDWHRYHDILPGFGFRVQGYPTIWAKTGTITHGRRAWEYARDYEPILIAVKGNPVLTIPTELSSIITYPSLPHQHMIHPHEKPIELLKKLITHCTFEGAKIVDPFAGSGVTLAAAKAMNRRYIGVERDKTFYDNIVKRLEKK